MPGPGGCETLLYADVSADINIALIRHEQIPHTYTANQILKDNSVQGLRLFPDRSAVLVP